MRLIEADLHTYAIDHDGRYPNSEDPLAALAQLYPDYGFGFELAGLSGSIEGVTNALQRGLSISNLTSWHYVPGLQIDDPPELAILWESKPGVSEDGRAASKGRRPVLLLGGVITNVTSGDWDDFLKLQSSLYRAVTTERNSDKPRPEGGGQ